MKVHIIMWGSGRTGGTRAIFELSNRLHRRGYEVELTALDGAHNWFNVEVPIRYVPKPLHLRVPSKIYRLLKLCLNKYRKECNTSIVNHIARRIFRADMIRLLSEHIPKDADVYVATYYPTALALHLSGVEGRKMYFLQTSLNLLRR